MPDKQSLFSATGLLAALFFACAAPAQTLKVEAVANPAGAGSSQASWSVTHSGDPLLSWVETAKDGSYSLRYATRHTGQWSAAHTIAAHRHFFRHPAELPEVISLPDGTLVAHWIETPGAGESDAEFIFISVSHDGTTWTKPVMANRDQSQTQHGLASIVASGDHEASIVWLHAPKGEDYPAFLMRTVIDSSGNVTKEEKLDPDVCTCCPTSVVRTAKGLLIAYRGHTAQDIRDITTLRFENGQWLTAKTVFPDGWKINACPTNAASASAAGDRVAIAWYTAGGGKARVEFAASKDSGATFTPPVTVSTGSAYGYVSSVLSAGNGESLTSISWLERGPQGARVLVRQISASGTMSPVTEVAKGERKALGYPRLLQTGGETWIAWGSEDSKLETARLVR
jgi:hypothetical protein